MASLTREPEIPPQSALVPDKIETEYIDDAETRNPPIIATLRPDQT